MDTIDLALQIAVKAHTSQLDKGGSPYILHPLAVGLMGETDEERVTGFLHDVVEDSDYTFDMLLEAGIPEGTVNALRLLTHDKNVPYMDYVQGIIDSGNPVAIKVKYNDLTHNYERAKDFPELQAKYKPAIDLVKSAIEAMSVVGEHGLSVTVPGNKLGIFACGCFWGAQHQFDREKGVVKTLVGYTGGPEDNPSYVDVRSHKTHHVEAVIVEYDPKVVTYEKLCQVFFEIHDPAQVDGVGPDIGPQYRSEIFYLDDEQKSTAEAVADILRGMGDEVNTIIRPAEKFWTAEEYHQDYYDKTGGSPYCHIRMRKFPRK